VGAVPKLEVPSLQMLLGSQEVRGWYSGTAADSEDGLNFSLLHEVRSMNEVYKLEQFKEGYERMMSGKARFPGGYDDGISQSVVGHAANPLSDAG
jgi:alcohol dehydrogenase